MKPPFPLPHVFRSGAPRRSRWLCLSLLYLGLLFLAGSYLYSRIRHFEGELFLGLEPVQFVLGPEKETLVLSSAQRGIAAGVLPPALERQAARLYGDNAALAIADLGFALRLDSVKPLETAPPLEELEINGPGGPRTESLELGTAIMRGGLEVKPLEVRPWFGLIRDSGAGAPMAHATLWKSPANKETELFLRAGLWRWCGERIAICLQWCADRAAAEQLLPESLGEAGRRWGLAEGPRVQSFSDFAPGTGAFLEDGTEVLLAGVGEAAPDAPSVIILEFRKAGTVRQQTVEANRPSADSSAFYEYPAGAEDALLLCAWKDGAALVGQYRRGKLQEKRLLNEGESFSAGSESQWRLELGQIMANAVMPPPGEQAIWQLIVQADGKSIGLRQGIAVQIGAYRLTYHRAIPPAKLQYSLELFPLEPEKGLRSIVLNSGESRRIGGWRLTAPPESAIQEDRLIFHAERTLGSAATFFGAFCCVIGAFGWVLARASARRGAP